MIAFMKKQAFCLKKGVNLSMSITDLICQSCLAKSEHMWLTMIVEKERNRYTEIHSSEGWNSLGDLFLDQKG